MRVRLEHPRKKKSGSCARHINPSDPTRRPGGAWVHPGKEAETSLLLLRLLGLLRLLLRRLLRFLSHSILLGVNGGTRHEGCSAEGQPRNILDDKLSRFGAGCPALSHLRHRVIHSSDAFSGDFCPRIRLGALPQRGPLLRGRACLTMPESVRRIHQSTTNARVCAIAVRFH